MIIKGYSDGSCKFNPGKGGWGCFYTFDARPDIRWEFCDGKAQTTNNEMELYAMNKLLAEIRNTCTYFNDEICDVVIFSDSTYVLNGIVKGGNGVLSCSQGINGWMKKWKVDKWKDSNGNDRKNKGLWMEIESNIDALRALNNVHIISLNWVKGHSNDEGNEHADRLSRVYLEKTK